MLGGYAAFPPAICTDAVRIGLSFISVEQGYDDKERSPYYLACWEGPNIFTSSEIVSHSLLTRMRPASRKHAQVLPEPDQTLNKRRRRLGLLIRSRIVYAIQGLITLRGGGGALVRNLKE